MSRPTGRARTACLCICRSGRHVPPGWRAGCRHCARAPTRAAGSTTPMSCIWPGCRSCWQTITIRVCRGRPPSGSRATQAAVPMRTPMDRDGSTSPSTSTCWAWPVMRDASAMRCRTLPAICAICAALCCVGAVGQGGSTGRIWQPTGQRACGRPLVWAGDSASTWLPPAAAKRWPMPASCMRSLTLRKACAAPLPWGCAP